MYGLNKYMIDINIETLAGTTFSLKVSPMESIQSVKAKIQRHEGIPISHQHLVWQSNELEDKCSLNDYNIPNGATIRMVLALRGGPINTRRMTTEDTLLRDVSDLMEIQEDSNLWTNNDSSHSINKHVTLLLFRDGDHLNLLRVIDRGDTISPISGAMSAASMYVPYDDADHDGNQDDDDMQTLKKSGLSSLISKKKKVVSSENQRTREKMMALRKKMNENKKANANKQSQNNTAIDANSIKEENNPSTSEDKKNSLTTKETLSKEFNELSIMSQPSDNTKLESKKPTSSNINNLRMKRYQLIAGDVTNANLLHDPASLILVDDTKQTKKHSIQNEVIVDKNKIIIASKNYDYDEDENENEDEEDGDDEDISDEEGYDEYLDEEYDDDDDEDDEDEEDEYDDDDDDDDDEDVDNEEDDNHVIPIEKYNTNYSNDSNLNHSSENVNNEGEYENNTEGRMTIGEDEENYDEDENELLLNKSEFLLNEDHQQTTNSPSNGISGSDLMAIMMMTVNSDQLSLNGGGVSSSLATTTLPTVITPLYVTDNENFVIPFSSSATTKNKYIRGLSKKKYDDSLNSKLNYLKNRKKLIPQPSTVTLNDEETLDKNQEAQTLEFNEANLALIIQEQKEKLEQLKHKKRLRRKRRLQQELRELKEKQQLAQNEQYAEQNETDKENLNTDSNNQNNDDQSNKDETNDSSNRRQRRRPEYRTEIHQIASFSPTTILVKTVSLENTKKKLKESHRRHKQNLNQSSIRIYQPDNQSLEPSTSGINNQVEENNPTAESKSTEEEQNQTQKLELNNKNEPSLEKNPSAVSLKKEPEMVVIKEPDGLNQPTNNEQKSSEEEPVIKVKPPTVARMLSSSQKRVSFIVSVGDDDNNNNNPEKSNEINTDIAYGTSGGNILSSSYPASTRIGMKPQSPIGSYNKELAKTSQQLKPLIMSGYKQRPPPKLNSLYTNSENVTSILHKQNTNDYSSGNHITASIPNNENLPVKNGYLNPIISNDTANYISQKISNGGVINSTQQPLLSKRNADNYNSLPSPSPTPNNTLNRLDIIKANMGGSILKSYQHPITNSSGITKPSNDDNNTSTIEISRLYSASHRMNKNFSVSANDLSQNSKTLKLPPVINSTSLNSSYNSGGFNSDSGSLVIGGSANNINSIGLNETIVKKKVNDHTRYCYMCKRKTGLASSYICRCGNNYCTQHRNAEAHNCTFDYKTEGRKLIEHSNPLVAAPKLPKI